MCQTTFAAPVFLTLDGFITSIPDKQLSSENSWVSAQIGDTLSGFFEFATLPAGSTIASTAASMVHTGQFSPGGYMANESKTLTLQQLPGGKDVVTATMTSRSFYGLSDEFYLTATFRLEDVDGRLINNATGKLSPFSFLEIDASAITVSTTYIRYDPFGPPQLVDTGRFEGVLFSASIAEIPSPAAFITMTIGLAMTRNKTRLPGVGARRRSYS